MDDGDLTKTEVEHVTSVVSHNYTYGNLTAGRISVGTAVRICEVIMTAKTVQDAYRIVFEDMMDSGCGLLVGKYDAKNGNESFMYGIATVMEWIACRANEDTGEAFSSLFVKNMIESKRKRKV